VAQLCHVIVTVTSEGDGDDAAITSLNDVSVVVETELSSALNVDDVTSRQFVIVAHHSWYYTYSYSRLNINTVNNNNSDNNNVFNFCF